MKTNIFLAGIALATAFTMTSCSNDDDAVFNQVEQTQKAHVRLIVNTPLDVTSRASLTANGKTLTDLYILDYDKASGKLLQVLHQTSTATDFAEPDLTLDYGTHTLKVIATRSDSPTLLDATNATWAATANVLTPVSATVPVAFTTAKTSDTFGAQQDVTVAAGSNNAVSVTLNRLVAKLAINATDKFPTDCSTISVAFNEHKTFSWQTFDVMEAVANQRTSDVTTLAGTTGTVISYFVLAPADGYTSDVTFTMNRTTGAPYASFTVKDVPFDRNKTTTITGSFYNHQQGFQMSVNDTWDTEGNNISI